MKYLFFLLLLVQCKTKAKDDGVVKTTYPKSVGYVNDFAHVLTPEQVARLDSTLSAFEKQTTNEIAIVTIDSLPSDTTSIESYTLELAREWGVGKKGSDNGLVFLFAMKNRKVRIETGTGTAKILSNEQCGTIIDTFIKPNFKKEEYYNGIASAVSAVMAHLSMFPIKNADH